MKFKTMLFVGALALACGGGVAKVAPDGKVDKPFVPPADALACTTDADCQMRCETFDSCCGQICPPCVTPLDSHATDLLLAWHKETCGDFDKCPHVECTPLGYTLVAKCVAGTCSSARSP